MGADIYLESVHAPLEAKLRPVIRGERSSDEAAIAALKRLYSLKSGYFRDNYNGYSLFAQLKLSWWLDIGQLLDDHNYLPVEAAKRVRKRIAEAALDLSPAQKVAAEQGDAPPLVEDYEKQRGELLMLLDWSIKLGEPLRCSL